MRKKQRSKWRRFRNRTGKFVRDTHWILLLFVGNFIFGPPVKGAPPIQPERKIVRIRGGEYNLEEWNRRYSEQMRQETLQEIREAKRDLAELQQQREELTRQLEEQQEKVEDQQRQIQKQERHLELLERKLMIILRCQRVQEEDLRKSRQNCQETIMRSEQPTEPSSSVEAPPPPKGSEDFPGLEKKETPFQSNELEK